MDVALLGATGAAGSRILKELSDRGHTVRALSRNPGSADLPGVNHVAVDAGSPGALVAALKGADAVVSSLKFTSVPTQTLIDAVTAAGVRRYVIVGGAGSLWASPGVREVDGPGFPDHVKPEARAGAAFLDQLRASDLDWTFFSPSRFFQPGERTGQFRLGQDDLLFGADGRSAISFEDYAVALVDELEHPRHIRQRFTAGY
jgi:putative NADH-flavin reductase